MTHSQYPTPFQFTEDMRGYVARAQTTFDDGYREGRANGTSLMFHLTLKTDDLERFLTISEHRAQAIGYIDGPLVGGRCPVEEGWFNLFVDTADVQHRRMLYRLFFRDTSGTKRTLSGHKDIQDIPGFDVWKSTTTLYTNIFDGHIDEAAEAAATPWAVGILHIEMADFIKELGTVRAFAPSLLDRAEALGRFGRFFLGSLWEVYGHLPSFKIKPYDREIPTFTTEGVVGAEITTYPITTADKLGISVTRFLRQPSDDVVLLIHGLTTSTDMFIMPEHYNLVQFLLDNGWGDVWTLDCRMSNRFSYNLRRNRYNMDDVALFDHPAAIAALRAQIGPNRRIHVICHCLGSVTFMMSLFGKALDGISSVVSNSVSLTPRLPQWSSIKLMVAPMLCDYVLGIEYANPCWRREPGISIGKLLSLAVSAAHHECDVPECHMLSFMWGTGYPAVYRHENMNDLTHRRVGDLFGGVSFNYFRHVRKMVLAGNTAIKYDNGDPRYASLPDNYLTYAKDIETPILFTTGQDNGVFKDSNIVAFSRLNEIAPGRHRLKLFPNYGHQDVFMGQNCHVDVFPHLLEFLNNHRGRAAS